MSWRWFLWRLVDAISCPIAMALSIPFAELISRATGHRWIGAVMVGAWCLLLTVISFGGITRYGPCIGLTLFKWGRKKIELWWAPADYSPPEHCHDNCDSEFTILWARNRRIYRKTLCMDYAKARDEFRIEAVWETVPGDSYIAHTPGVWGKWLSVRAGVPHKFEKGSSFMLWLCVETWLPGCEMSLAKDFRITEQPSTNHETQHQRPPAARAPDDAHLRQ